MRARLWRCGLGLALFITTLTVGNAFIPPEKQLSLRSAGHDFLAFYTAGTLVREGSTEKLYDLDAVSSFQHALAPRHNIQLGDAFAPWWNPSFYALVFAPLSMLPYTTAWFAWMIINIATAAIACLLLARMLPDNCDWRSRGLVPLLVLSSLPFIQSLGHGQNSSTSLLLLAAVATFWRQKRGLAAGLVLGLLFYKPQLAALLSVALVITLGRRAVIGILISGMSLLCVTLVALPGTLADFLTRVPHNLHLMQSERSYVWDRHVTFTAFWRFLLQGNSVGQASTTTYVLATALMLVLGMSMAYAIIKCRKTTSHDPIIATTIIATPLLMPFYFDYDLLLLAVPAVLFASERINASDRPGLPLQRIQTVGWVILYIWLFVNPAMTALTRVNATVLLLAGLATASIIAASRRTNMEMNERRAESMIASPPLPLAA